MAETMIEKMATAIHDATDCHWASAEGAARAALLAILEPGEERLDKVVWPADNAPLNPMPEDTIRAYIDAILSGEA